MAPRTMLTSAPTARFSIRRGWTDASVAFAGAVIVTSLSAVALLMFASLSFC